MFKGLATAVLLSLFVSSIALAIEGRKAIRTATTITESGSYIVVKNLTNCEFEFGDPRFRSITIMADDVDLDLNGFTLRCGEPVIQAEGVNGVTIRR